MCCCLRYHREVHPSEMVNRGFATGDNVGYYTRIN